MRAREKEFVVAVVDDEAALCEALSSLLRPAGYGVKTFASAENFLASESWHSYSGLARGNRHDGAALMRAGKIAP
jgi:FixJ family two-component response regulator